MPPPAPINKQDSRGSREQDALLMPPPPAPGSKKIIPSDSSTVEAGAQEESVGPMPLVPAEDAIVPILSQDGEPKPEVEESELSEPQLPEGFFDDPEQDAKARGVEAPSVIAQRDLEEGLKRFEKEMLIEREKAEEARNEIEEDRNEEQTAEEDAFQKNLRSRIEALHRKKAEVACKFVSVAPSSENQSG
eukprot:CAMPEP_0169280006 /NCGR_PEP_ID=MMETSP1016-20121227/55343_1 /TAXON_ID=342587 /ORGANISM="Karlodinium micrum, Strain CCMP2283" /LENGTH=189 /DNA_ID=CAMNT_0009368235 /DNA_START=48 /DNA_END=614 /DNA_ORIENTATION=-